MEKLSASTVCVVGVGGVGGACAEALVRAGIGNIILIDHDDIDISNVNRQLFATTDTVGEKKVICGKSRLLSINPKLNITALPIFYDAETSDSLFDLKPDFIVDAIDTVTSKLLLAVNCKEKSIPLISSMGTGNRLDPTKFLIGNITDTAGCGCGLARVMRRELKARGIFTLSVLYSTEQPQSVISSSEHGRHSPASVSFCPPVAGFVIASEVIKRIIST